MAREKQRGRALQRVEGDLLHIVFADRGQRTMKIHIKHYQHRPRDGFGSHQNGRHKLGWESRIHITHSSRFDAIDAQRRSD